MMNKKLCPCCPCIDKPCILERTHAEEKMEPIDLERVLELKHKAYPAFNLINNYVRSHLSKCIKIPEKHVFIFNLRGLLGNFCYKFDAENLFWDFRSGLFAFDNNPICMKTTRGINHYLMCSKKVDTTVYRFHGFTKMLMYEPLLENPFTTVQNNLGKLTDLGHVQLNMQKGLHNHILQRFSFQYTFITRNFTFLHKPYVLIDTECIFVKHILTQEKELVGLLVLTCDLYEYLYERWRLKVNINPAPLLTIDNQWFGETLIVNTMFGNYLCDMQYIKSKKYKVVEEKNSLMWPLVYAD
jgi:hypothetical protein